VAGRPNATDRMLLGGLLVVDLVTRHSASPTLTRPAGKATVSWLEQHVMFLAWLDGIGPSRALAGWGAAGEDQSFRR